MTPTRLAATVAVAAALAVAGCGGQGDASQSDVKNKVEDTLTEDGYTFEGRTFDADEAETAADCVSQTMFESDEFTPDERNEIARATNGDPPDPELVTQVEDLVSTCLEDLGTTEEG